MIDKSKLSKDIEAIIELSLEGSDFSYKGSDGTMADFLFDSDNNFDISALAENISDYFISSFINKMKYSFQHELFSSCETCGDLKGKWICDYDGSEIQNNSLKGNHIVVPK